MQRLNAFLVYRYILTTGEIWGIMPLQRNLIAMNQKFRIMPIILEGTIPAPSRRAKITLVNLLGNIGQRQKRSKSLQRSI